MISESRIRTVFRKHGGPGGLTLLADKVTQPQFVEAYLEGKQAVIVRVESPANWFALTSSELVVSTQGDVRRTNLKNIESVVLRNGVSQLEEGKVRGAPVHLKLADGSLLSIPLDGGAPFTAMLNVFMYIARVNRPSTGAHALLLGAPDGPITIH